MTDKRFENRLNKDSIKFNTLNPVWDNEKQNAFNVFEMIDMLNHFHEENEQLKNDRFICLDCKHSGYTEIGCLCEKEDHWTDYKTECEDYEELE